jgi:predicted membrane protein
MANPSKPLTFGLTILLSIYMYVTLAIVLFGAVYNLNYPFGGIWLVVILPFIGVAFIWKLYSDEQGEYQ